MADAAEPGLTVVMAVRDRLPVETVRRWADEAGVDELVVVDFGSAPALPLDGLGEIGTAMLVRVGTREPWSRALALNVGIAVATRETILAIDPGDELRGSRGHAAVIARGGSYLTGFGADKGTRSDIAMFRLSDWREAGGFHEYMLGWGFEDEDFFNRLEDARLTHRFFAPEDLAGGLPERFDETAPSEVVLPGGLERQRWFQNNRNKVLAGLVPWNAAMQALRPRRFGRPGERTMTCDLAPRTPLERRQQDCATYLAARFLHDVAESVAYPMLRTMIDERFDGYAARAGRQRQIDRALALLSRTVPTE